MAQLDPEGSVTVIDLMGREVRTATFTAFNNVPLGPGIRIFGPNATVAQDLEPESIAVLADSTTASVKSPHSSSRVKPAPQRLAG